MLARLAVAALVSTPFALASLVPAPAAAQIEIAARGASITIGGRLHSQYSLSSVAAAQNDFFLRRARLNADVEVNDFLTGRVQVDFAGTAVLKDAYFALDFSDAFVVSIGQFKRSFDIFELASSTDLSLIERDGRIEGLGVCTGVGSICSYSRFTEALGYSERDQGLRVAGASGRLAYQASFTNGPGSNAADENDTKSAAGRLTLAATENVQISGQVGLRDYVDADGNATALAFGGDVQVGTWREGLLLMAAVVGGDNWLVLDPQLDPATFLTAQATLSYYSPVEGRRFAAVEPLVRVSYGDPDTGVEDDGGILLTPGLMLYVLGRNKVGLNLDYYTPQSGSSEWSLKAQAFLYF